MVGSERHMEMACSIVRFECDGLYSVAYRERPSVSKYHQATSLPIFVISLNMHSQISERTGIWFAESVCILLKGWIHATPLVHSILNIIKLRIHKRAKWFVNHSQMVRIPFTANQNLSIFCANTKRTGCTGCSFRAPGVLCSAQVWGKLINCAPLTRRMRMAQRISGMLVYTKLKTQPITCNAKCFC